jgi:hypothetical protein
MNDLPREKLRDIIIEYGQSVCDNPRRVEGLLRDKCGEHKREIFALVNAIREGVPIQLRATSVNIPAEITAVRLIKQLRDNLGLSEDIARWTVETWVWALGVITEADLQAVSSGLAVRHPSRTQLPISYAPAISNKPQDLIVDARGHGYYRTISEAVANAQPGTRIKVRPGLYNEQVILDKPVEVIGDGRVEDIVLIYRDGPCTIVRARDVSLHGLTLSTLDSVGIGEEPNPVVPMPLIPAPPRDLAAVVIDDVEALVQGCNITASRKGLMVTPRHLSLMKKLDTVFQDYVAPSLEAGDGVNVIGRNARLVARYCTIHDVVMGIRLFAYSASTIDGCNLRNCGLYAVDSRLKNNLYVRQCQIHENSSGIHVFNESRAIIRECDIKHHMYDGVSIGENATVTIDKCNINENGCAVSFAYGGRGTVQNCDLRNNREPFGDGSINTSLLGGAVRLRDNQT